MEPSMGLNLPAPPPWSLAIGDVGRIAAILAAVAFALGIAGRLFAQRRASFNRLGTWSFALGCVGILVAYGCLTALFVAGRLEFAYVWQHCDRQTPLQYRIAGVWAGQEGSFLLWAAASALFGLATFRGARAYSRWYAVVYGAFMLALCGILVFESPFTLNLLDGRAVVPPDGIGLAPTLLDFWVIVHPPVIFLGFGALTVLFAYAMAALCTGDLQSWVPQVRPWAILSTTLVGLGLCMGGFWAYETLGWGGFWMWDPVENVSFVPWVLGAALIHGLPVQITKGKWVASNLLLAALPFLTFAYGTYLTRSGVLGAASVHSFSAMQKTAFGILLAIIGVSMVAFLALWIWRVAKARPASAAAEPPQGLHREGVLRWGASLLCVIGVLVLAGMSVPAVMTWRGMTASAVQEGLYHQILVWLFVPTMLVLAAAPFVGWQGLSVRTFAGRIYNVFCIAFGLVGLVLFLSVRTSLGADLGLDGTLSVLGGGQLAALPWMLLLIGLCLFVLVGAIWRTVEVFKTGPQGYVALLSHAGVAILMAGLIVSRGFETKATALVPEGGSGEAFIARAPKGGAVEALVARAGSEEFVPMHGGLTLTYGKQTSNLADRENRVLFDVSAGSLKFEIAPGLYYKDNGEGDLQPVVWPYIKRFPLHDLYFSIQPPERDASEAVRLKPGESADLKGFAVTFVRLLQPGELPHGVRGVGALLKVKTHVREFTTAPTLVESGEGMHSAPAPLNANYNLALVDVVPSAGSIAVKLEYVHPIYQVEVFYKPMTILVWAGTALLTLAGLLAAWVRRR